MYVIGIDAGTTSVSGVLLNTAIGKAEKLCSYDHHALLKSNDPNESIQDPASILANAQRITEELIAIKKSPNPSVPPVAAISITGQMHGLIYIDAEGEALSPLYTWQDTRSRDDVPNGNGKSWQKLFLELTGKSISSGHGLLTYFINKQQWKEPPHTARITSLPEYLSMKLVQEQNPYIDMTDAHAWGLFSVEERTFDSMALKAIGISPAILPEVNSFGRVIGTTHNGIPIVASVGDNQAGFIGAVKDMERSLLINIGTSAQISAAAHADEITNGTLPGWISSLEVRPLQKDHYLLVGASPADGNIYRALERLFHDICKDYVGVELNNLFETMNKAALDAPQAAPQLKVDPRFLGTKHDPLIHGAISNITMSNFTHTGLISGFLHGIVNKVYNYFRKMPDAIQERSRCIVGTGNGLRKNPLLQRLLTEKFQIPLLLPTVKEAAAGGRYL